MTTLTKPSRQWCQVGLTVAFVLGVGATIAYAAGPAVRIDWSIDDGLAEIPIEQRPGREVSEITGRTAEGALATVRITPEQSPVANYAFDVTPARLVSGLITERGVCAASREGLLGLYPERHNLAGRNP